VRSILGIDTASPLGSVALAQDGRGLSPEPLEPGKHSSGLSVKAAAILAAHSISWSDLAGIAVSRGPGSFTGLRIGLAWAKGVVLARGIPLFLVSAHEAAARAHRDRAKVLAPMIPAERGRVEWSLWRTDSDPALLADPETADFEEAVGRLKGKAGAVVPSTPKLAGELAEVLRGSRTMVLEWMALAPAVAEIGDRLFLAGTRQDPISASPTYGRPPNARKAPLR
jgi:tRNA threonylcarbamoyladenosine biosynthesis protein TsaB